MSFLVCLPFMYFDSALEFSANTLIWVLILGIFQYGLANICYAKGCQLVDKVEASLLLTLEPIFNPIPVALFCGEMMKPMAMVGFIVVIFAVTAYALLPMLEAKFKKK